MPCSRSAPELAATSDGRCRFSFTPEPEQGFNRGGTDYFVNGRKEDIGAFDSPKHAGMPLGTVCRLGPEDFDLDTGDATRSVNNGDALTWWGPPRWAAKGCRSMSRLRWRYALAHRTESFQRPILRRPERPLPRHRPQSQPRHGLGAPAG